jgi:hypothetical protein
LVKGHDTCSDYCEDIKLINNIIIFDFSGHKLVLFNVVVKKTGRSVKIFKGNDIISLFSRRRECFSVAKLIVEPKKAKDGQIDYIVTYHDPKSDNQFTVTTTNNLDEAVQRLKETLENEVQTMIQKK